VSRGIKKLKSGEIVPIYIFYLDKHGGLFNCNTVKVSDGEFFEEYKGHLFKLLVILWK